MDPVGWDVVQCLCLCLHTRQSNNYKMGTSFCSGLITLR